ncbi:hypothetical protein DH09_06430 [Bacillaceae bacterium JMAK1]|nr:hypothetical protein DH09_06430 [Bacillaceae bacterium JMAK1]
MKREQLIETLEERKLTEVITLIEEAENGEFDELELVESLGLLQDQQLNDAVIDYLKSLDVEIIYVRDEE